MVVWIEPAEWWIVSGEAERAGRPIADVVRDGVLVSGGARLVSREEQRLLDRLHRARAMRPDDVGLPPAARRTTRDAVRELVLSGLDDGTISTRLHLTRRTVAQYRREAGLPPNKLGAERAIERSEAAA